MKCDNAFTGLTKWSVVGIVLLCFANIIFASTTRIVHQPVQVIERNRSLRITAEITPDSQGNTLLVFFRNSERKDYSSQKLLLKDGVYTAELHIEVDAPLLQYFLMLIKDDQKLVTHPESHPYIRPHRVRIVPTSGQNIPQSGLLDIMQNDTDWKNADSQKTADKSDQTTDDVMSLFGIEQKQMQQAVIPLAQDNLADMFGSDGNDGNPVEQLPAKSNALNLNDLSDIFETDADSSGEITSSPADADMMNLFAENEIDNSSKQSDTSEPVVANDVMSMFGAAQSEQTTPNNSANEDMMGMFGDSNQNGIAAEIPIESTSHTEANELAGMFGDDQLQQPLESETASTNDVMSMFDESNESLQSNTTLPTDDNMMDMFSTTPTVTNDQEIVPQSEIPTNQDELAGLFGIDNIDTDSQSNEADIEEKFAASPPDENDLSAMFAGTTGSSLQSRNQPDADRIENETIGSKITIVILSPEPGSKLNEPETVVALSFLADQGEVDLSTVQLFFDKQNVTDQAMVSTHLLSFSPPPIPNGKHHVRLLCKDTMGQPLSPVDFDFWVGETVRKPKPKTSSQKQIAQPISVDDTYQQALNEFYFRNYVAGIEKLKSLLKNNATHPLASNFQYWIGECYFGNKLYQQALEAFQQVKRYKHSPKRDDALMMTAMSYIRMGKQADARRVLNEMMAQHPKSEYVRLARRLVRK
ncbi:tetratricopeptide repeat protein [candidate division KSB1 bacterium]|nr:tetratricopeptide repeat protein [candidate division KSB1 bacterium]